MDAFSDRLETYYQAHRTELIRAFRGWGSIAEIDDAVQEAMLRLYASYAEPGTEPPDNLGGLVRVTIRNILIDGFRRAVSVPIGEVRTGPDGLPTLATPGDPDEVDFSGDPALPSKFVSPEDEVAWKQLLGRLFDALDPKWVAVASMAMLGTSPEEIGAAFGQNGYVLRRHARMLICRVLAGFAAAGDVLAATLARDVCKGPDGTERTEQARGRAPSRRKPGAGKPVPRAT